MYNAGFFSRLWIYIFTVILEIQKNQISESGATMSHHKFKEPFWASGNNKRTLEIIHSVCGQRNWWVGGCFHQIAYGRGEIIQQLTYRNIGRCFLPNQTIGPWSSLLSDWQQLARVSDGEIPNLIRTCRRLKLGFSTCKSYAPPLSYSSSPFLGRPFALAIARLPSFLPKVLFVVAAAAVLLQRRCKNCAGNPATIFASSTLP